MVTRTLGLALLLGAIACAPTPPPRPGDHHGSDADVTVTRLGHAGLLLTVSGRNFLVDPWLHDGLLVRHREPLGMHPSGFPAVTAVLLTDDDSTRVDSTALAELARSVPRAVGPPALRHRLAADGFREVIGLARWQEVTIDGVRITAVPARGNGYVLHGADSIVYVAGEDGDAAAAAETRRVVGRIDVAVVPIGGRRTLGVRAGTGPEQAAASAASLGARRIIPCAYGAAGVFPFVSFAREPVARFRRAAAAAGIDPGAVIVLDPGESWHYYR